jgi:hypothetical protein
MKEWKASELDIRCSDACTRAGLTALLISALAFSMLPFLARREALDALGKYMALRLSLMSILDNPHSIAFSGSACHRSAKASRREDLEMEEPVGWR